jgi:hypothetical protein
MANGQQISPVLTDPSSVQDMGPGGVLNQLPSLKATADFERLKLTVLNDFKDTPADSYSAQHANAVSDGDNKGRGENSNEVGTNIDKLTKNTLLYSSGNKYKPGMGYDNKNFPEQHW